MTPIEEADVAMTLVCGLEQVADEANDPGLICAPRLPHPPSAAAHQSGERRRGMFRHLQRLSFDGACLLVTAVLTGVTIASAAVRHWAYDQAGDE